MKIQAAHLEESLSSQFFEDILQNLPSETRNRIYRFIKTKDAWRSLIAELLIRNSLMETFQVKHNEIILSKNKYGKPYWERDPNYYFNVSHSGDWIVYVTSPFKVGIDIERIYEIDLSISNNIFSKVEINTLNFLPQKERIDYFFDLWTIKESYIKAIGKGLHIQLDSFSIIKIKENFYLLENEYHWYFRQYNIDRQYKMSVCSQLDEFSQEVEIISSNHVVRRYLQLCNK